MEIVLIFGLFLGVSLALPDRSNHSFFTRRRARHQVRQGRARNPLSVRQRLSDVDDPCAGATGQTST
jgi:hypothetical protein